MSPYEIAQEEERLSNCMPKGWLGIGGHHLKDGFAWLMLLKFHDFDKIGYYGMCYGNSGAFTAWIDFTKTWMMGGEI